MIENASILAEALCEGVKAIAERKRAPRRRGENAVVRPARRVKRVTPRNTCCRNLWRLPPTPQVSAPTIAPQHEQQQQRQHYHHYHQQHTALLMAIIRRAKGKIDRWCPRPPRGNHLSATRADHKLPRIAYDHKLPRIAYGHSRRGSLPLGRGLLNRNLGPSAQMVEPPRSL